MKKNNTNIYDSETSIRFTCLTKKDGIITKEVRKDSNGNLIKDSSKCQFNEGTGEVIEIDFSKFGDYTSSLGKNQAIVHGIPVSSGLLSDQFKVVSEKKFHDQANTITRTKKNFEFTEKNAPYMVDYDPDSEIDYLTPDELIFELGKIFPEIIKCCKVVVFSTSSFIYDNEGNSLTSEKPGYHIYFVVQSGSDIQRFNEVLFKRLILAGYGYIFTTKSGSQIVRTIFDKMVNSPERLDFVAGAACMDGLEQKRPAPKYYPGKPLDTARLQDLTPSEEEEYEEIVVNLKQKTSKLAENVRNAYKHSETKKLLAKGIPESQAKNIVQNRTNGKLIPGDIIRSDNHGCVDVAELLLHPEKYDGETFADPLEPDYGGGKNKAKFFVNSPETGGNLIIHSFAHGGRNFYLTNDWDLEFIKKFLQKKMMDKNSSKNELVKVIALANFNSEEEEELLEYLVSLNVGKKRAIKRTLKRQRTKYKNQRQALSIRNEGLIPIEYSDFNITKASVEADEILCEGGLWGYYRYAGLLSYVIKEPPNKMYSPDGRYVKPPEIWIIKQFNKTTLRSSLENCVAFLKKDKESILQRIPVPDKVIETILNHPESKAPQIKGIAGHPFVRHDGDIVLDNGLDLKTGIYVHNEGDFYWPYQRKITKEDSIFAYQRLISTLFGEFEWKDEKKDLQATVAFFLTAIQRIIMETSPGFLIEGNTPGIGKTTLARIVHLTSTGDDLPVSDLTPNNNQETKKAVLAILIQSPEMICFDNIPDGTELNDSVISKIITSPVFQDRVLGVSEMAKVPTNSTIVLTGNNISLGSDLVRRFVKIEMMSNSINPESRQFNNRDVKHYCLQNRNQCLIDGITIIKGYLDAGSPMEHGNFQPSGFNDWDKFVRCPILWVSGADVIDSIRSNYQNSVELLAMTSVLNALSEIYEERPFRAVELCKKLQRIEIAKAIENNEAILFDGVSCLIGNRSVTPQNIGQMLKKMGGRVFEKLRLTVISDKKNGNTYVVEKMNKSIEKAA